MDSTHFCLTLQSINLFEMEYNNLSDQNPTDEIICKNCGNHYHGKFCNDCGQKLIVDRYTVKHLFNIAFSSFDLHKGVLYTAKCLFVNPGRIVIDYLGGKTKCYYNPISYLLIIASIYALLMIGFNIFDSNLEEMNEILGHDEQQSKLQGIINTYIKKYLSFISIITIPFYSLFSRWILKKHKLNYAEHLIINSFFMAQYLLIFTCLIFVFIIFPSVIKLAMPMGLLILVSYYTYAFMRVFNISFIKSFLSTLGTFLGGLTVFYLLLIILFIVVIIILMLFGFDIKSLVQQ